MKLQMSTLGAALALALAASPAAAVTSVTFDLTGSGNLLGGSLLNKQASFLSPPITMQATAINTEEPPAARLHQNGAGLGVTADLQLSLENNQINNIGDDEAIIFDFNQKVSFLSISLSETDVLNDRYEIYGTNTDLEGVTTGGLPALTSFSTLLASGSTNTNPTLGLAGTFRYLIATVPGGSGDGYRVASITVSAIPLPAGLPLLMSAIGLAALVRARRST